MQEQSARKEEIENVLDILMERMKTSSKTIEDRILSNIRTFVMPHIDNLKRLKLNDKQKACVDLIESNLVRISSPLIHNMRQFNLTPMEVQVANLIKDGMTTKDIVSVLRKSKASIDNHRYNLRRKLGLNKTRKNLRSFLLSIS